MGLHMPSGEPWRNGCEAMKGQAGSIRRPGSWAPGFLAPGFRWVKLLGGKFPEKFLGTEA
jgi:hypothetical protein